MHVFTERHRQLVITLVVLAAIALSVLLLVAALAGRGDGTPAAAYRSGDPTSTTPPSSPVSLPNLHDPCVRQEFANRFAPGSFGISPELPHDLEAGIDCRGSDAVRPIAGEPGPRADVVVRRVEQVRVAAEGRGPGLEPLLEATRKAEIARLFEAADGPTPPESDSRQAAHSPAPAR